MHRFISNKEFLFCIGDIHGEFPAIGYWIKQHDLKDCDIIFLGDFGLGFYKLNNEINLLTPVNKECEERNIDLYIIRGNHDNPDYYNSGENKLKLSHIHPLEDYSIISFKEHNILCIGGAISIDRTYRSSVYARNINTYRVKHHCSLEEALNNVQQCHWVDEAFKYDKLKIDKINKLHLPIDIICSHAAPSNCYPTLTNNERANEWMENDLNLKNDLTKEREDLRQLLCDLISYKNPVKAWYYGHYHSHNVEDIDGVRYTLLDMGRASKRESEIPGACFDMAEII
jgi:predicted phosphodiesterase